MTSGTAFFMIILAGCDYELVQMNEHKTPLCQTTFLVKAVHCLDLQRQ
jgi:hypothetical protein